MKILIITNTRIGDAVLTTGVINHFLKTYPQAAITIAVGYLAAPLFEDFPNLAKLIPMRKKKYSKQWIELWLQCYRTKWDIIIDFKQSPLPYFLWAKKRFVRRPRKAEIPKIEENAKIANLTKTPYTHLWIGDAHLQKAKIVLAKCSDQPIITLAPTANWLPKTWPLENFIELAKQLLLSEKYSNAIFMIISAPHEAVYCKPLFDAIGIDRAIDLTDDTHLLTKAACIQQSRLFIGNDSGLMHIASACNTPIIALFGPTNTTAYYPQGENALVIKASYTPKITPETDQTIIKQISVEDALKNALFNSFH